MWRILKVACLSIALSSCATTEPQPPGPGPGEPTFVCGECDGTKCKPKWFGKQCKAGEDEQGRFCIAQGKCIIGIPLPGVALALESAGSLPPRDDEALAAEERINRYFRQKVVPKLWSCWKDLKGEGVVTIQHDYIRRADGNWIPYSLRVIGSSLSRDQNEIAIKCMNQAAQGTSFASDKWDGEDRDLALVWSWPVPYPD